VGVVIWIVRILVLLLILRFVLRLVFGLLAQKSSSPGRPGAPGGKIERAGGDLVRDPQCGTYVPKSRAVVVATGGETRYFCSTNCRDAYEHGPIPSN